MIGEMPELAETTVALRIFGDSLEPAEITRLMGVEPSRCRRKGEMRRSESREHVVKTGSWLLKSDFPGDLNAKISAVLAQLPSNISFWRDLHQHYQCDVFCGLFMQDSKEGTTLQPQVLLMLGERRLALHLDIYGDWNDDEPEP